MSATQEMELADLREKAERQAGQIEALKRLVSVLDCCADDVEAHYECLDRGWDLDELKKEAGL